MGRKIDILIHIFRLVLIGCTSIISIHELQSKLYWCYIIILIANSITIFCEYKILDRDLK